MRVVYFPIQDASIYSDFPDLNTGLDEIVEVGKSDSSPTNSYKRALVQFDLTSLAASIANGSIPSGSLYEIKLYVANAENVNNGQKIELWRTAESWDEGSGRFYQETIQDTGGATWKQRRNGFLWSTGSPGNSLISGSIPVDLARPVGDVTVDVTSWVNLWLASGSNFGVTVKFPDADELDPLNLGSVKFFSNHTHTIYRPALTAKWNDQTVVTGSLTASPTNGLFVQPANMKTFYTQGESVRVDLIARSAYPLKTIDTMFTNYIGNRALPATSYFSIIDELTGTVVVPFDDYSRVSCDGTSSYIKFRVENMYPLRYYRLKLRVDHDGLSEIFDTNQIFKVKP
jgi:hypothetical protein